MIAGIPCRQTEGSGAFPEAGGREEGWRWSTSPHVQSGVTHRRRARDMERQREGDRGGQMGVAAVEKENVTAEGRGRTQRHRDHSRGFARDSWIHWRLIGPHVTRHVTSCLL